MKVNKILIFIQWVTVGVPSTTSMIRIFAMNGHVVNSDLLVVSAGSHLESAKWSRSLLVRD
jgi:hypothetical protein